MGKKETPCRYQNLSPELELPVKLEVGWSNFIGEIEHACSILSLDTTNDWNGCSDSVEANIGMTPEQFYQKVPCKARDFYDKNGMKGWSGDLFIGWIFGKYDPDITDISPGPNNETTWADEFVVFYNNLTPPETYDGNDLNCTWFYKLPQGFSCGKGAPPDPTCEGLHGPGTDTFTPVPCSEIELKVLDHEARCPLRDDRDDNASIRRPSQPDCWASINWRSGEQD